MRVDRRSHPRRKVFSGAAGFGLLALLLLAACAPVAPAPPPPAPPPAPPAAPTNLHVTTNAAGQVSLAWNAPAPNGGPAVTGYVVTSRRVPTGSVSVAQVPDDSVGPQIIGGSDVSTTSYPWVVQLWKLSGSSWYLECGGTLIDPSWVLTAGHCTAGVAGDLAVVVGHDTVSSVVLGDLRTVSSISTAPGFTNPSIGVPTNDAALLHLSVPVVGAAPLSMVTNPADAADLAPAVILGWGCNDNGTTADCSLPTQYPDHLKGATVGIFGGPSTTACGSYAPGAFLNASMVCAGVADGTIDTCFGDSGGPLMVTVGGHPKLAGITSWGSGCAAALYPGVYTRVSSVAGWIGSLLPDLGRSTVSGITGTSTTITSLWSGDTYAFQVAAVNSAGTGAYGPALDVAVAP